MRKEAAIMELALYDTRIGQFIFTNALSYATVIYSPTSNRIMTDVEIYAVTNGNSISLTT